MPYSGPDKFFVSNGNYDAFMQWLFEIRADLIQLPNQSAAVLYRLETLRKYAENRALSQTLKGFSDAIIKRKQEVAAGITKSHSDENKSAADITDEKVNESLNVIESAADTVKTEGIKLIEDEKDGLIKKQEEIKKSIPEAMAVIGATIKNEIASIDRKEFDVNNPIPENDRINANTRNRYGLVQETPFKTEWVYPANVKTEQEKRAFRIKSRAEGGVEENPARPSSIPFPEHGKESIVAEQAAQISAQLSDTYQFEVVSGYKSKDDKSKPKMEYKGWIVKNESGEWDIDGKKTFSLKRPYSMYANEILERIEFKKLPGSYKFFIEKLHGRYRDGTPYKMNEISSQKDVYDPKGQNLTNRMVFSAYIDNYNDSFNVSSTDYSFLGRGETVPIYKSTTRDMTLEFTILADYSTELMVGMEKLNEEIKRSGKKSEDDVLKKIVDGTGFDWGLGQAMQPRIYDDGRVGGHIPGMYSDNPEGLWSKMTFLAQLFYPYYRDDGKMKEQPMFRLRIADFYDCVLFPKSMNVQMTALGDGPQIDMNVSSLGNMPLGIKITLNGQIVHNYEPASNFHGFYNRIEYDSKDLNPVTSEINLQKGKIEEAGKKNSPYELNNTEHNEKNLDLNNILNTGKNILGIDTNSLFGEFSSAFGDFASVKGINLNEAFSKGKLKKAMSAYLAINEVVNHLKTLEGLNIGSTVTGKKGAFASTIQEGQSLGTDSFSILKDLKQKGKDLIAQGQEVVNNVTQKANSVLQSGNILETDIAKKAIETAKSAIGTVTLPQTMQDILDKTKKII